MPVISKPPPEPHSHPDLVSVLAKVIRRNQPTGPSEEPKVIEEPLRMNGHKHVTVVWDRWQGLPAEDRSVIILDAYRCGRGEPETRTISIALGLTNAEAERLGISA